MGTHLRSIQRAKEEEQSSSSALETETSYFKTISLLRKVKLN